MATVSSSGPEAVAPPAAGSPEEDHRGRRYLRRAFGLILDNPVFESAAPTPHTRPTFVEGTPFCGITSPPNSPLEIAGRYSRGGGPMTGYTSVADLVGQLSWTVEQTNQFLAEVTNAIHRG